MTQQLRMGDVLLDELEYTLIGDYGVSESAILDVEEDETHV